MRYVSYEGKSFGEFDMALVFVTKSEAITYKTVAALVKTAKRTKLQFSSNLGMITDHAMPQ